MVVKMQYSALDFMNKVENSGYQYITNYQKKAREADTNVQKLQDDLVDFRKQVRNLRNYNPQTAVRNKIQRQLEDFVDTYNEIKSSSSSTDKKKIEKYMSELDTLFEENKKNLKKIGIKESNDKLVFDSDTFSNLEDDEVTELCDVLFSGNDAFINQVNKTLRKVERTADESEYYVGIRQLHSITRYSENDISAAKNVNSLKKTAVVACEKAAQAGTDSSDIIAEIIPQYVLAYNEVLLYEEQSSSIASMKELHQDNGIKSNLASVGVSVEEDGTLTFNNKIAGDEAFLNAFKELFGKDAKYAASLKQLCDKAINSILHADRLGISFDESI